MILLYLAGLLSLGTSYECIEKCDSSGQRSVTSGHLDGECLIAVPDNPTLAGSGRVLPCQLDIQANCSAFCQIQINFAKFKLPKCNHNITTYGADVAVCDRVQNCEYVVLHERGIDGDGGEYNIITHLDGDLSSQTYLSRTDRILVEFCYRSETFTARNLQLEYKAIDMAIKNQKYMGPISVYILGFVALLLAIAICIIRWSPWLKPCLDPPLPAKTSPNTDV